MLHTRHLLRDLTRMRADGLHLAHRLQRSVRGALGLGCQAHRLRREVIDLGWRTSFPSGHVDVSLVPDLSDDPPTLLFAAHARRDFVDVVETSPDAVGFFAHGESVDFDEDEEGVMVLLDGSGVPSPGTQSWRGF
jgi:hypothetical protein